VSVTLADPYLFDPVQFPGVAADEAWPPMAFDFQSSWLRGDEHGFERGASGEVIFVRDCGAMRLVLDIETAHSALDIEPGSRDFRLLRLVPSALRLVERIAPGDAVPPTLLGEDGPEPEHHHLYVATTALADALGRDEGAEGQALLAAFRRVPPGARMFEMAAARCVAQGGFGVERVASLAKGLQRLASAHAGVLAAQAMGPDFTGMERMIAASRRVQTRWNASLLAHGLLKLERVAATPRVVSAQLLERSRQLLGTAHSLRDVPLLVREQARLRDRLLDINHFWRRCAAAWATVHAETTDPRQIEELARNALRRLSLPGLHAPP